MQRVVQKEILYICPVCKVKYFNKKEAVLCEKRILEKKKFLVGDRVSNIEPRYCQTEDKDYVFSGKIVRILGPQPSDFDYEMRWLGSKRLNYHVFEYEVVFRCPHCKDKIVAHYYAPELKPTDR